MSHPWKCHAPLAHDVFSEAMEKPHQEQYANGAGETGQAWGRK